MTIVFGRALLVLSPVGIAVAETPAPSLTVGLTLAVLAVLALAVLRVAVAIVWLLARFERWPDLVAETEARDATGFDTNPRGVRAATPPPMLHAPTVAIIAQGPAGAMLVPLNPLGESEAGVRLQS